MDGRELTAIELKVLRLFVTGPSSREIAIKLTIHQTSALDHLRVITRKLGAANRVHAVMIATELKLVRTGMRIE